MIWKKVLLWSVSLFLVFNIIKMTYPEMVAGNEVLMVPLNIAVPSICNFLFMALLVSIFVLIWWFGAGNGYRFQRIFIPYGKYIYPLWENESDKLYCAVNNRCIFILWLRLGII